MTPLIAGGPADVDATSAGRVAASPGPATFVLAGGLPARDWTGVSEGPGGPPAWNGAGVSEGPGALPDPGTTSGEPPVAGVDEPPRDLLLFVKRRSGLTWEEIAEVLGVSRRTVHFWASGRGVDPRNEQRLREFRDVIEAIDRGLPSRTRAVLIGHPGLHGRPFDLLREGRFVEALRAAGVAAAREVPRPRPLSPEARAARRPPHPVDLLQGRDETAEAQPAGQARDGGPGGAGRPAARGVRPRRLGGDRGDDRS